MSIQGVDVYDNTGQIDWSRAKAAGILFGIPKCDEGTWGMQQTFPHNWAQLGQLDMPRLAYHFAAAERGTSPEAEADTFWGHLQSQGGLRPKDNWALDLENGSHELSDWALRFKARMETHVHVVLPFLYSYPSFIASYLTNSKLAKEYALWLASVDGVKPGAFRQWANTFIWQYGWHGHVPGIPAEVDQDQLNVALDQLIACGVPVPVPTTSFKADRKLAVAQHLRSNPAVFPVDGPLLPVGTLLMSTGLLTPNWVRVMTKDRRVGWVERKNSTKP